MGVPLDGVSLQGDEAIVLREADLIQSYPFHSETYFIPVPAHVQHCFFNVDV